MILDDAEIADIRKDFDELFDDTVEILEETKTSNGQGGHSTVWAARATVPCTRAPAGQGAADNEPVTGDAVRSEVDWVFSMPHGTIVKPSERLRQNGVEFEVRSVTHDRGRRDFMTRVQVSERGMPA